MKSGIGDGGGKRKARPRVLVIEDDDEIAGLVAYQLTRARYRVETAADGAAGLSSLHREIPDFVVLDRMLPGLSGDEVLRAIRDEPATRGLPVLMLTAKNEREDRIEGLEMGADDYLTKPFSPRELVLRVDAILRRAQGERLAPATGARVLSAGNLRVNLGSNAVTLAGKRIQLTPTEFRLLKTLMERPGSAPKAADSSSRRPGTRIAEWPIGTEPEQWTCTFAVCAPSSTRRETGSRRCGASGTVSGDGRRLVVARPGGQA